MDEFIRQYKERHQENTLDLETIHHVLMKEYGYIPISDLIGEEYTTTYYIFGYKIPIKSKTKHRPQLMISTIMSLVKSIVKETRNAK
jgi:hypothetical protein